MNYFSHFLVLAGMKKSSCLISEMMFCLYPARALSLIGCSAEDLLLKTRVTESECFKLLLLNIDFLARMMYMYDGEVKEQLGEGVVACLLEAIDNGELTLQQTQDLASKLHPKAGGDFQRARELPNFKFDRTSLRNILSSWYQYEVEEVTRNKLERVLSDPDIGLRLDTSKSGRVTLTSTKKKEDLEMAMFGSYKSDILQGKVGQIHSRIQRLKGQYIGRKLCQGEEEVTLDKGLEENKTILIRSDAGGGKSSYAAKLMEAWAQNQTLCNLKMLLLITPGNEQDSLLHRILWRNTNFSMWSEEEKGRALNKLQKMASEGELGFIIDGIDEFSQFTEKDKETAEAAATDPDMKVNIRSLALGLMSQTLFPNAKVIALGRTVGNLVDEDRCIHLQFVPFSPQDTKQLTDGIYLGVADQENLAQNEDLLKNPLLLRSALVLKAQNPKLDLSSISNSNLYLEVFLSNISFNKGKNLAYTKLSEKERKQFADCLRLCHEAILESEDSWEEVTKIQAHILTGIEKQTKKGLAFIYKTETCQIKMSTKFLQKCGIFQYHESEGSVRLEPSHLSFVEFGAAAFLLIQHNKNPAVFEQGLKRTKNWSRFHAMASYMIQLLSNEGKKFQNAFLDNIHIESVAFAICAAMIDLGSQHESETWDEIVEIYKEPYHKILSVRLLSEGNPDEERQKTGFVTDFDFETAFELIEQLEEIQGHALSKFEVQRVFFSPQTYMNDSELKILSKQASRQTHLIEKLQLGRVKCYSLKQWMENVSLLKKSQEWEVVRLILQPEEGADERAWIHGGLDPWGHLAKAAKRGKLGDVWTTKRVMEMGSRRDVKRVWEKTAGRRWWVDNQLTGNHNPNVDGQIHMNVNGRVEVAPVEGWQTIAWQKMTEILDMVRLTPEQFSKFLVKTGEEWAEVIQRQEEVIRQEEARCIDLSSI